MEYLSNFLSLGIGNFYKDKNIIKFMKMQARSIVFLLVKLKCKDYFFNSIA